MIKFSSINIATIVSIIGAILVASNFGYTQLGFFLFWIGSIFWLVYGYSIKNKQIMIMNGVYFIINLIGILRN